MNSRIVVVGSLNADFVIGVDRFPVPGETLMGRHFKTFPGGKGANQAYAAAKLGGHVSMIGQVGGDTHGEWLKQNLALVGVNVTYVDRDPDVSSGVATITIDAQGQNQIIVVSGANGTLSPDRLDRSQSVLASAGFVLLQLEIPLDTVAAAARIAKDAGAVVILDPAPAQRLSDSLLACVDYLTPNETELAILMNRTPGEITRDKAVELARELRSRGSRNVIVKLGAQGALLVGATTEHFWPALRVPVVDTTAAGDAFNAAFAVALAEGRSEIDAGLFATLAAGCSVTRSGAQPSMPTRAEADRAGGLP